MSEKYIKAADCEKYFYEHLDDVHIAGAMNAIDEMPAADVAPVVRCKDCKNAWHSLEGLRCCIWATSEENCETEPDAFCSFGERKDNGND